MAKIRSLSRGLDALALLNRHDSASATEISQSLGIPRATVYRILETLCDMGLVRQYDDDHRFRITPKVRILSVGFSDEDYMASISQPVLQQVTREVDWPAALVTIAGSELIVRDNTDQISPLALEKFSRGYRMSILQSASGRCILANMSAERRKKTLEMLAEVERRRGGQLKLDLDFDRTMKTIRRSGFAIFHRHRRHSDLSAIAVPILTDKNNVEGAIALRYARTAIDRKTAVERFSPILDDAAKAIAKRLRLHEEIERSTV